MCLSQLQGVIICLIVIKPIILDAMPPRSNEFQKLVRIVKEHAAQGANVTESAMLPDATTGDLREVDIYIEGEIAGHQVAISVECTGAKGRAPVTWVEQLHEKHRTLSTDLLVLVSRAGFTKGAIKKADFYGIQMLELEQLDTTTAEELFGEGGSLWCKTISLTPHEVRVGMLADSISKAEFIKALPDHVIYNPDGSEFKTVGELAREILSKDEVWNYVFREGTEEHNWLLVQNNAVKNDEGNELCMRRIEPEGLRTIDYIRIHGKCVVGVSKFPAKQGKIGDAKILWGHGEFLGSNALFVASDTPTGGQKLTITKGDTAIVKNVSNAHKP